MEYTLEYHTIDKRECYILTNERESQVEESLSKNIFLVVVITSCIVGGVQDGRRCVTDAI